MCAPTINMCILKQLVLLTLVFGYGNTLNATSYIKPCRLSDEEFEKCALAVTSTILEHFVEGDEFLRVAPINVLRYPVLSYEYGDDFAIRVVNALTYGLANLRPTLIKKVPDENKIVAELTTDKIVIVGEAFYDVNIKNQHISNYGFGNITFIEPIYKYNFTWETVEKGGINYTNIVNEEQDVKSKTVVHNINFIDADETTGAEINQFLNDNSEEIEPKTRPSITNYMKVAFHSFTDIMFSEIPYDMLFLK